MTLAEKLETIPPLSGAYILEIRVLEDFKLQTRGKREFHLEKGRYLYCGSANGRGGMRSRITRHCKRDKKLHWHIDGLTTGFGVNALYFTQTDTECQLVAKLCDEAKGQTPLKGFGSSDCEICESHLVKVGEDFNLQDYFSPSSILHLTH